MLEENNCLLVTSQSVAKLIYRVHATKNDPNISQNNSSVTKLINCVSGLEKNILASYDTVACVNAKI